MYQVCSKLLLKFDENVEFRFITFRVMIEYLKLISQKSRFRFYRTRGNFPQILEAFLIKEKNYFFKVPTR